MKAFNRFIAVLFAIAFVICAPIGVLAFNIDRAFLSAPHLMQQADEVDFYSGIGQLVSTQLRSADDGGLAQLPDAEIDHLVAAIVPREVVRPVVETAVTETVAFARGEREEVVVSMAAFKHELQTRFPEALLALVATKPVCASRNEYGSYTCRPRPADQAEYEARVRDGAVRAWAEVPDSRIFISAESMSSEQREAIFAFNVVVKYAPWVALGLLGLIAFFAVRGVRGLLLWLGVPLMVAGLFTVGCWLLSSIGSDEIVRTIQEDSDPGNVAVLPLFQAIFADFVRSLMIWAGIIAVTGFGMTIGGALMPRADPIESA